jgi:cyclopropane-fatty-acyl-phospholipid synthase
VATQIQIEATYGYMDELFRIAFGDHGDCSCAMYDHDFSKTLEDAQRAKHEYILTNLNIAQGKKILDIGCGWGPVLRAVQERGAKGIGLTLSSKQAAACKRNGLEVVIADWKEIGLATFGQFDAIVSIGSFEHYCSKEEFLEGKQESIYRDFFHLCHDLLPSGGRLYLQTMLWGRNAPRLQDISLQAPKGSNGYIVAVAEKFYPGSWLPASTEQIVRSAEPFFKILSMKNGRSDYIETMTQWSRRTWRFSWDRLFVSFKTLRYFLWDRDFRFKLELLINSYNRECFRREIMDHQRLVFEKNDLGDA